MEHMDSYYNIELPAGLRIKGKCRRRYLAVVWREQDQPVQGGVLIAFASKIGASDNLATARRHVNNLRKDGMGLGCQAGVIDRTTNQFVKGI